MLPDLVNAVPVAAPDDQVVGLALDPGEYPVSGLRVGDIVAVLGADPSPDAEVTAAATVLAERATVYAVEPVTEGMPQLLVSLAVPADVSTSVAAAAAADQARLVLLEAGS